jgi:hypothetical protein
VYDEFKIKPSEVILWSHSMIVLAWLRSELTSLQPFVGVRVAEIQATWESDTWRFSKSEETLHSVGRVHEPRELFSMELDTDTNSVTSDRPRDFDVMSGISSSSSYQEARLQNGGKTNPLMNHTKRKLKSDHLANLKNLQASSC